MKKAILLSLVFTLLGLIIFAQTTIHVPDDVPTIQDGIDAADDGDTVLVAQGTYVENIDFDGKAIWVASHWLLEQDSAHILNTIIDGSEPSTPAYGSVVMFTSDEDTTSVLCGFTITGGTGSYYPADDAYGGGGIRVENSSAKIIHNRIVDNHVQNYGSWGWGGGITADNCNGDNKIIIRDNFIAYNGVDSPAPEEFITNGGGAEMFFSNYIIERNVFRGNSIEGCAWGSGIRIQSGLGVFRNNVIDSNNAILTLGFNVTGGGAGIFLINIDPGTIVSRNVITNNTVTGEGNFYGGGMVFANNLYSDLVIESNWIANNTAKRGGGMDLWLVDPACYIANNIIRGNYAELSGGGIQVRDPSDKAFLSGNARGSHLIAEIHTPAKSDSVPVFVNNTIVNNSCGEYGGGIHNRATGTDVLLFNNIIYGNTGPFGNDLAIDESSVITHLYNNNINTDEIYADGGWQGESNIYADPEFYLDTYHLMPTSPCINAGTWDVEVAGITYDAPEFDIDGEERPFNTYYDIGVDEWIDYSLPVEKVMVMEQEMLNVYPNPVQRMATIGFDVRKAGNVEVSIQDINGRRVSTAVNSHYSEGSYQVRLDASPFMGGIYFCILKTETGTYTRKMIVIE